jgi:hypothetical protein
MSMSPKKAIRRCGSQYVILKPSIKVLDADGAEVPFEIAGPVKLRILGYQHNKPFNQAVNKWRELFFSGAVSTFAFPQGEGSSFKFRVRRSPAFAKIGLPGGGANTPFCQLRPLLKYGVQIAEPTILSDRRGTSTVTDIRCAASQQTALTIIR